jgi:hypothetical protein
MNNNNPYNVTFDLISKVLNSSLPISSLFVTNFNGDKMSLDHTVKELLSF